MEPKNLLKHVRGTAPVFPALPPYIHTWQRLVRLPYMYILNVLNVRETTTWNKHYVP